MPSKDIQSRSEDSDNQVLRSPTRKDFIVTAMYTAAGIASLIYGSRFLNPQTSAEDDREPTKDSNDREQTTNLRSDSEPSPEPLSVQLDVPIYGQRDPAWAEIILGNNPPGSGYTIGDYGCAVTSYAMIESYFAKKGVNPANINTILKQAGAFGKNDGNLYILHSAGQPQKLHEKALGLSLAWQSDRFQNLPVSDITLKQAQKYLRQGLPVLADVNFNEPDCNSDDTGCTPAQSYSQHFAVITGFDKTTGVYTVNGPWYRTVTRWSPAYLSYRAIQFWAYTPDMQQISDLAKNLSGQPGQTAEIPLEHDTPETGSIDPSFPEAILKWRSEIETAAGNYAIDPNLIAAVILQESGGNQHAGDLVQIIDGREINSSGSGAIGLMQVMPKDGISGEIVNPDTGKRYFAGRPDAEKLYDDPAFNIDYGAGILADNLAGYDSIREALKHYGPWNVEYEYADKVLAIYCSHGGNCP